MVGFDEQLIDNSSLEKISSEKGSGPKNNPLLSYSLSLHCIHQHCFEGERGTLLNDHQK